MAPCTLLGADLRPLLEGGLFWCQLLAGPAGLCSFALLFWLPSRDEAPRG